jgi:hypothetical protein
MEAERIYQALVNYVPEAAVVPPATNPAVSQPVPAVADVPAMPVAEFTSLLEELTLQKSEYHKQMCIRSNQLHTIPDHESAKDLVDEIDRFYDLRNEVAVKIRFLKENGRLPEDVGKPEAVDPDIQKTRFMENLPADKYELSRQLQLKLPNLSKARTALERATDVVTKQKYSQKVAQLEMEVALMRSKLTALS